MSWQPAPSVKAGLAEATRRWPNRSRASDGLIGDAAHAARKSDHNPDSRGIVHAFDLTHDPAHGVDCGQLAAHLVRRRDPRVNYIIWNVRICESPDWTWKPYKEKNGHTTHMHVSIKSTTQAENDTSDWWNLITEPDALVFDGNSLLWTRDGQSHRSWPAVSGRPGFQSKAFQVVKNKGPLPEGKWDVRQTEYQKMPERGWPERIMAELGLSAWPGGRSSWGEQRIWLKPCSGTNTYGRSGFSIHGGATPGSAGCIDLTFHMPSFSKEFLQYGRDLVLTVV